MKLSWFSNAPWAATGYGNQTRVFAPRIRDLGHEVSISAFYGLSGAPIYFDRMRVYPLGRHPYGQDVITAHAVHAGAEAIISLLDAWVCQPQNIGLPWFPWFPIDHEPIPNKVLEVVRHATKGITMSKFGQRMAEQAGLDTYYIPHGIDTNAFTTVNRQEARTRLGLSQDAFIVGMVAANKGNPPRKAFFEQIAAFAALKQKHSDALLYLHTDDGTRGGETVDLIQACTRFGLKPGSDVLFVDQYIYNLGGLPDAYMRDAYNAMDVMMLASLGEGFGIPLVEAQACGCPVITGDWTAMGELVFGGWKISKTEAQPEYHDYFDAFQWRVNSGAVAERLLAAYEMRGVDSLRERARDGAQAYDADRVTEKYWKPVLADIEKTVRERVDYPLEVLHEA
jgi:glycosyltransferase involved in cell wall biosynthesis